MEHTFQCVYCWSQISMLLDPSVPYQVYIEDCEVCCRPIEVSVRFEQAVLQSFEARSIEQ